MKTRRFGSSVAVALGFLSLLAGTACRREVANGAAPKGTWSAALVEAVGTGFEICKSDSTGCQRAVLKKDFTGSCVLRTSPDTRGAIQLDDGSRIALDRDTQLRFGEKKTDLALLQGAVVADLTSKAGERTTLQLPSGSARVVGAKLAARVLEGGAAVDVARGSAELVDMNQRKIGVRAGEEGRIYAGLPPFASAAPELGEALLWSELEKEDQTPEVSRGLGELSAKKPGEKTERNGAVKLSAHHVRTRISGAMARTEVEEVFTNTTDDTLEGIYRFPVPAHAEIEKLALEVDGKLVDGAFVDRDRGAAIWRGALVTAAPQLKQQIHDEIVWVPGPWRDPALLEWQRGGRFELRIFPIKKRESRRVVLTYTEHLTPTAGVRRYIYPLPHDPGGSTKVDDFSFDLRVRGHDAKLGVRSFGYPLSRRPEGETEALVMDRRGFEPNGDLVVEYALRDRDAELSAWSYAMSDQDSASAPYAAASKDTAPSAGNAFVTMALRPKLPSSKLDVPRQFAVIVDASRSMFEEGYHRASALTERLVHEIDPRDRVTVLACDTVCTEIPGGATGGGMEASLRTHKFLSGIRPEGASNFAGAIQRAGELLRSDADAQHFIVYVGDGTPTAGPIRAGHVQSAVRRALRGTQSVVIGLPVGAEADLDTLRAATRATGGVVIPYSPGQRAAEAAYAAIAASYAAVLKNARLELPEGLTEVAPRELGSLLAGHETLVVARQNQRDVSGEAVLRGELDGAPFEQRYRIDLKASADPGNAFVPRMFAAERIRELELSTDPVSKKSAVELSTRFGVASRYTSLLVLESPAMFRAFGLDNQQRAVEWSGEEADVATTSKGEFGFESPEADAPSPSTPAAASDPRGGGFGRAESKPSPKKAAPAPSPFDSIAAERSGTSGAGALAPLDEPRQDDWNDGRRRRWIPMRRIWERKGAIFADRFTPKSATLSHIAELEANLDRDPNRRLFVRDLYTGLMLFGEADRAKTLVERWSEKEPLDAEALTARSDLAAENGDRAQAIRILGSVVDVKPGDVKAILRLGRLHRWAGETEIACAYFTAAADLAPNDASILAQAVRCLKSARNPEAADELLLDADPGARTRAEAELARSETGDVLDGDFQVLASWSGSGSDLDIVLWDPEGHRVSWLGAPNLARISATDVTSTQREGLGLRGARTGEYTLELVRASGREQIRGDVEVSLAGTKQRLPFTLDGSRARLAVLEVQMKPRLVPIANWQ